MRPKDSKPRELVTTSDDHERAAAVRLSLVKGCPGLLERPQRGEGMAGAGLELDA